MENNKKIGRARILVVDDDDDTVTVLSILLERQGYDVRTVTTGIQTLQVARDFKPHLIYLDTAMPGQDGNETTRQFRQDPELKDVMIVAVSGYCRDSDRARALAAGANLFLPKPRPGERTQATGAAAKTSSRWLESSLA